VNSAQWQVVLHGKVPNDFVGAFPAEFQIPSGAPGRIGKSLDFEYVVVVALKLSDSFVELLSLFVRQLKIIQSEEDTFGGYVLIVVQVTNHIRQPAASLVSHLVCLIGPALGCIRAELSLLSRLASRSGFAICFHRTFVDARYIVFYISQSGSLFGSAPFHRADACFHRSYSLANVLLSRTAGA
jgi:hypothetical protein